MNKMETDWEAKERQRREDKHVPFQAYHTPPLNPSSPTLHTPRRPVIPRSSSSSALDTPLSASSSSGRKKTLWGQQSTPPSTSSTPASLPHLMPTRKPASGPSTPTSSIGREAMSESGSMQGSPAPGLTKKRSSGQLLASFGKGLSRVGSVMKRTPNKTATADVALSPNSTPLRPTPTRQGSRLGLSKQGSIRRQVQQGSWRGKRAETGPEAVQEEDEEGGDGYRDMGWQPDAGPGRVVDVGDEGIGLPFNVTHELHVTPGLHGMPTAWHQELKAAGMTDAQLLMIAAARQRQAAVTLKPIRTGSTRRPSQRRKESSNGEISPQVYVPIKEQAVGRDGVTRIRLSDRPAPSSPRSKLPALTHLDDVPSSMDGFQTAIPGGNASAGPSRSSSLHPSPIGSRPPSAFASPTRGGSSKRLSDQLRGFASIELDAVGSWADDLLGMVGEDSGKQSRGKEMGEEPAPPVSAFTAGQAKSPKPPSPRSPLRSAAIRRVPVPETSGAPRCSTEAPHPQSPTSSYSHAAKHTRQPSSSRSATSNRTAQEPGSCETLGAAPVETPFTPDQPTPIPRTGHGVVSAEYTTPMMSMTHSHSQSLSTAEDLEVRTPSTSENDDGRPPVSAALFPASDQRCHGTEGTGWVTPKKPGSGSGRDALGRLGGPIELSIQSSLTPTKPLPKDADNPISPRSQRFEDLEADYDLSIPSPLRPPPNPHFSLPASAASDAEDDYFDPNSFSGMPEPGSPILKPADLKLIGAERYGGLASRGTSDDEHHHNSDVPKDRDRERMEGMRGSGLDSRKQSEGSIIMIHPYSPSELKGRGSRIGSEASAYSHPGSRQGSESSGHPHSRKASAAGSRKDSGGSNLALGAAIPEVHPRTPALVMAPHRLSFPSVIAGGIPASPQAPALPLPKSDLEPVMPQIDEQELKPDSPHSEEDHLSPLPPHPPLLQHLSHRNSARSLRSSSAQALHGQMEDPRGSMAYSTFSGESEDYSRDSLLGARVLTAQKQVLGGQDVGRMSVWSLSGYMGDEAGAEEDGGDASRVGEGVKAKDRHLRVRQL